MSWENKHGNRGMQFTGNKRSKGHSQSGWGLKWNTIDLYQEVYVRALWFSRARLRKDDGSRRGLGSKAYNPAWSLPDSYFSHVSVYILPITYQTLIMVFAAYEPPWMCANNSTACLESNSSSALSKVYSTATRPIELYERRCSLNRSDWKFAEYDLYEGPHHTIVDQVRKDVIIKVISCHSQAVRSIQSVILKKPKRSGVPCDLTEAKDWEGGKICKFLPEGIQWAWGKILFAVFRAGTQSLRLVGKK